MNDNKSYSIDFWLDIEKYGKCVSDNNSFNINLIKLASIRKSISNFVRILTRKNIPVLFNDDKINRNEMGKIIRLSADINSKDDFDVAIGLALHEGAHSLLTDFDMLLNIFANIPSEIFRISDSKNISRNLIEKFICRMFNIIEDRYIDNYIFQKSPGYRGYYVSMYDRFWHDSRIDVLLKSDEYKWPSLESYYFRILNLTNVNSNLMALPRLDEIADVIDLSNMERLVTTRDRIEVAFSVAKIVVECVCDNFQDNFQDNFDYGTKIISEISEIISGKNGTAPTSKSGYDLVSRISEVESDELKKLHHDVLLKQTNFLMGKLPKKSVSSKDKSILDLIENHGISLVRVGSGIFSGIHRNMKINCIVVKKMTRELIFKGHDIFPLSNVINFGDINPLPSSDIENAVHKGISLGIKLGRKLQLRQEINSQKFIRKKTGKINTRQLHEIAFDADDIFYNILIDLYQKSNIHISVDASTSMIGDKWLQTMTTVVAICKATSMIDNIHTSVSFRTTQQNKSGELPYVVMAYDSKIDKFSKVKTLFPYLHPTGCTPEGLAFEAIMNLFTEISPDENNRYLLNLSDGEPYYVIHIPTNDVSMVYANKIGVSHTKSQINKIKKRGVEVLSYFIESKFEKANNKKLLSNFKEMYGKSAKVINVNNIIDLAKTMNEKFLSKEK